MADPRLWAVYKRRTLNAPWQLVFVLPNYVTDTEAEECIRLYESRMQENARTGGHKLWFLLLRQHAYEVQAYFQDHPDHYIP